jgi:hypothetical protein
LQSLFNSLGTIKDLLELTLGTNFPLASLHRLVWTTDEGKMPDNTPSKLYLTFFKYEILNNIFIEQSSLADMMITLNPMQIRTFQVTLQ